MARADQVSFSTQLEPSTSWLSHGICMSSYGTGLQQPEYCQELLVLDGSSGNRVDCFGKRHSKLLQPCMFHMLQGQGLSCPYGRRYLTFYSYTLQLLQLLASLCSYLPKVSGRAFGAYKSAQGKPCSYMHQATCRDWGWHPLRVWQMTWLVQHSGWPMWCAAIPFNRPHV